jgi:hypothetical protein
MATSWILRRVAHVRTFLHSVRRLLVTANFVPISPIFVILMMETVDQSV